MDLLILVTLGTQTQSFKRLLDYIEKSEIKDEIIVQAGYTEYSSKKMKIRQFMSYEEMEDLIEEADIVITHGGTGSIVLPLKKGKIIIACARLEKFGEHVDNHQLEIVETLSNSGHILYIDEKNTLTNVLKLSKNFTPSKFVSNSENFMYELETNLNK